MPESPAAADRAAINPFVRHDFLSALEDSRSVGADTGWKPQHLVLESPDGHVLGCLRERMARRQIDCAAGTIERGDGLGSVVEIEGLGLPVQATKH